MAIALGLYLLVGHYVKRPWITASLVILLLSDRGLRGGRLLFAQIAGLWDHVFSRNPSPIPYVFVADRHTMLDLRLPVTPLLAGGLGS